MRTGCYRFDARSFALFRFLSTIHLHSLGTSGDSEVKLEKTYAHEQFVIPW